jgi:octaprenyl-diphosphate synthase
MNLTTYVEKVKNEIVQARYKAFATPSLLPLSHAFAEIITYDFKSTGKLLRPLLTVLTTDALGGQHEEGIHLGTAVELTHAGALVADDIIDDDELRHNQATVWKRFGIKAAVLYSIMLDVAAASSVRTLSDHKMSKAFKELLDAFARTSYGAMREAHRNPWDAMEYSEVINGKTATLFRMAARLGCISTQASDDTTDLLGFYGEQSGIAFQLMDDIVDIKKSINEWIPLGDVKEGKVTLPIILLKNKYPEFEKEYQIYSKGVKDLNEIPNIMDNIKEGIKLTEEYINSIIEVALKRISIVPMVNGYKSLFIEYPQYIVESMRKEYEN